MYHYFLKLCFTFLLCYGALFAQVESHLQALNLSSMQLKSKHADIFFPATYQHILQEIDSLQHLSSESGWADYEAQYQELHQQVDEFYKLVEKISQEFITILPHREKAVLLGAASFAPALYEKAEVKLRRAAEFYRDGSISSARQKADEAKNLYQKAEISCIRNNLVGKISIIIQEAKDYNAEFLASETYTKTKRLLKKLETMIRQGRADYYQLVQVSDDLQYHANYLLTLSKTLHYISQSPENAESYIQKLETQVSKLAVESGVAIKTEKGLETAIIDIMTGLKHIKNQNNELISENKMLVGRQLELEAELKQYKSLASREKFLRQKISRARILFDGKIEKKGSLLTIYVDSLNWKGDKNDISAENQDRLVNLAKALNEFPSHPVLIRYIQLAAENTPYQHALANRRAKLIRDYVKNLPIFRDKPLEAIGFSSTNAAALSGSSHIEVAIDLTSYLSFDDSSSPGSSSAKKSE